jgi:hypothetical protein
MLLNSLTMNTIITQMHESGPSEENISTYINETILIEDDFDKPIDEIKTMKS